MWDGTVVVPVSTSTLTRYSPQGILPAYPNVFQYGLTLFLLRPDGSTETRAVETPWPGLSSWTASKQLVPFKAIPDGAGGSVVGWSTYDTFGDTNNWDVHVARVLADGTVLGSAGPVGDRIGDLVLGEDGTVLVTTYMEDGRKAGVSYLSPGMGLIA